MGIIKNVVYYKYYLTIGLLLYSLNTSLEIFIKIM